MNFYKLPKVDPILEASYDEVRKKSVKYSTSSDEKLVFGPSVNKFFTAGFGPVFLGFWMLGWPFLALFLFFQRRCSHKNLIYATLSFGVLWSIAVGTTLTVAVVHSFDIDRYLHLLSAQHSLILAVTLVLTLQFVGSKLRYSLGR